MTKGQNVSLIFFSFKEGSLHSVEFSNGHNPDPRWIQIHDDEGIQFIQTFFPFFLFLVAECTSKCLSPVVCLRKFLRCN